MITSVVRIKWGEKLKAVENCARMFNVEIVLDMKKVIEGKEISENYWIDSDVCRTKKLGR